MITFTILLIVLTDDDAAVAAVPLCVVSVLDSNGCTVTDILLQQSFMSNNER